MAKPNQRLRLVILNLLIPLPLTNGDKFRLRNVQLKHKLVNYMRFERERDIPAFRGATWRERGTLRKKAYTYDRSIFCLMCIWNVLNASFIFPSKWLVHHFTTVVLPWIPVYLALSIPFGVVFWGLFVTPRIRRALESHE